MSTVAREFDMGQPSKIFGHFLGVTTLGQGTSFNE